MKHILVVAVFICVAIGQFATARATGLSFTDGTVMEGELAGMLVFSDGKSFAVVDGKDILKMDDTGAHVQASAVVITGGVALSTDSKVFGAIKIADVLGTILPLAAKKDPVHAKDVDFQIILKAVLHGQADGPGAGSTTMAGARVFFFKRFGLELPLTYPLLGELRSTKGTYRISPQVSLTTIAGVHTIRADTVVHPKDKSRK